MPPILQFSPFECCILATQLSHFQILKFRKDAWRLIEITPNVYLMNTLASALPVSQLGSHQSLLEFAD